MELYTKWSVLSLLLVGLCISGSFAQKVGDTCTADGDCTSTLEKCVSTKCECATAHINNGSQTCITNVCATGAPSETTCNAIPNFVCANSVCACDADSVPVTAAGPTKGSCAAKNGATCTAAANCIANSDCTATKCACKSDYMAKADNTVCLAKAGTACSAVADCVANTACTASKCACATDYVSNSGVCAKEVGVTCTVDGDCTVNAECTGTPKACACKSTYKESSTKTCVAQNGSGTLMISTGLMLLNLFIFYF